MLFYLYYMKYKLAASWSCPFGYIKDSSAGNCTRCIDKGLVFLNSACIASCPTPYIFDNTIDGCIGCPEPKIFYNRTCVDSCPLTTFFNAGLRTCEPCAYGCDSCTGRSKYSCMFCSEGFFFSSGYCSAGCPTDTYANPVARVCEKCQAPCETCSGPDNFSCTSCPTHYYMLNGTCVESCPSTYYIGFLGELPWVQIPACLPKLILSFELKLKTEARKIEIKFNYGISTIMAAIVNRIRVQIANTQIDSGFYTISAIAESTIRFEYMGDQYYPPKSLLEITIDLESDFNSDPYQQFTMVDTSQTIQLKEIYPFTKVETQIITISSSINDIGAGIIASGQAASSFATGGASLSLVRMQMISEIIQLLRFVDIQWPANVNQLFSESNIDPGQMVLPVDFITPWNQNLENFNTSLPQVFKDYELSLFITVNFSNELSNILLIGAIAVGASILIISSRTALRKITADLKAPKTNARRTPKVYCTLFLLGFSRLLNRIDVYTLWNIEFMFLLSIYETGVLWSLANIRYSSEILDPATSFTKGSLGIAIGFLFFYSLLTLFVFKAVVSNQKYVVGRQENLWPRHIKKYKSLFDDFQCKGKMQVLFVPLSLIRGLIFSAAAGLLIVSPETQMILLWFTQTAFVAYMVIFAPLKNKWEGRLTLLRELMAFGSISFGLIIMIIERFGEVDATTLNETGFAFIAFCLVSTLSGGVICLLQVLGLLAQVIKYLKNARRKKNAVHPIKLTVKSSKTNETNSPGIDLTSLGNDLNLQSKGRIELTWKSLDQGQKPAPLSPITQNNLLKVSKAITTLSPEKLSETPQGTQLLESITKWWVSNSEVDTETIFGFSGDTPMMRTRNKRETHVKSRFSLFSEYSP